MKVLVIGSGGREHALVWKLAQSPRIREMFCAPGNAGTSRERLINGSLVANVTIPAEDLTALLQWALQNKPDLIVVGPDNPLALGIVDLFESRGFAIWGPNKSAARFESSKVFSQGFMERHGIPTAAAGSFTNPVEARAFAEKLGGRCAVKADGLALGKGVIICETMVEANAAINGMLVQNEFGAAGGQIVIQELLEGPEVSIHAICDGGAALIFPESQDHKRALDDDLGPNTGGMGAYSPTPYLDGAQLKTIDATVIQPWLRGCQQEGISFRGILYPGLMLTPTGPKVLEFNARFGDPETQVYLTRLKNDLVDVIEASLAGRLRDVNLEWTPGISVCVVMASGGYPSAYRKGQPISGLDAAAKLPNVKVFHAGTTDADGQIVTNGGRVLGVTAWSPDLRQTRTKVYEAVSKIQFEGAHFRKDIAAKWFADGWSPKAQSW